MAAAPYQPRIPYRFMAAGDDAAYVDFPVTDFAFEIEQGLSVPVARAVGASGAHDFLGWAAAPKDSQILRINFEAYEDDPKTVDDTIAELQSKLWSYGRGRLWTRGRDGAGDELLRWTWARALAMPQLRWAAGDILKKAALCSFRADPDWFGAAATTGTRTVTTSPDTFTINNPGNAPAKFLVFRFRANAAAGFTNPALTNLTNGYGFSTTRDSASANSEVKVETEENSVEYSNDNGVSYADDFANFSLGATHVGLMALEPGDNLMQATCDGTPNFDLEWSFYAPYH